RMNPQLLIWILDFVNTGEVIRWMISYFTFTWLAFISWLFSWVPPLARRLQPWLEPRYPGLWLLLLATSYVLTDGLGQHQPPLLRKLQPRTS
ncbi:flavin-dependent dehydrogenase, partial [Arthrospira sp. O9.13F]